MNIRTSLAVFAFATLTTPLAAYADAPSGDFDQLFPISKVEPTKEQVGRHEHRNYVETGWLEGLAANTKGAKTREQVRQEIASAPLPVVGA
jgi:hypothetical protein